MYLKNIIDEDFTNYKTCAMFLGFPSCNFKCEREPGGCPGMCQNSALSLAPSIEVSALEIVCRYLSNPLPHAIVCGGLEPFDSFTDLCNLVETMRAIGCEDDIVIYTGYNKDEVKEQLAVLQQFKNIVVKFGRFKPNEQPHYDEVLGIELASNNQYAERIS